MNRFLTYAFLLILVSATFSRAQKNKGSRYEAWWKNIRLASADEIPYTTDTMLVMYSTRYFHANKPHFFDHAADPSGKITILLAVCKNEQWKMFIMPTLDSAMSFIPVKKDIVFYVEGLGKNYPIAMYRAAGMTTQYQVNVIMLDYATLHESRRLIRNFYFAQKSSRNTANTLAHFLSELEQNDIKQKQWISGKNKTLFIHSMGNAMLKEAMQKKLLKDIGPDFLNRLVLNAACVNQARHATWVDAIHFSKEIFIHHNQKDFELLGAHVLTHRLKLGAKPKKPWSKKAVYVDFANVLGPQHNAFLNKPGIRSIPQSSSDYYQGLLHGDPTLFSNTRLLEVRKANKKYTLK
jgi:hypothetical protein